jgi:AcrR family transcriptional regulator
MGVYAAWGPHGGGSGEFAAGEERERLVDAFTKVATERGYAATTVEVVVAEAGLGPADFQAHFRDPRQCLLAAYDRFFDRLIEEIEDSMDRGAPWPDQVRAGIGGALGFVGESAAVARFFAIEAPTLGAPVIDRYIAAIERIVALLRRGRGRSAAAAALPPLSEAVLVAGAVSLVTGALLAEEQSNLSELEVGLAEVLLLPYSAGPERGQGDPGQVGGQVG